jgi:hypothetical protein
VLRRSGHAGGHDDCEVRGLRIVSEGPPATTTIAVSGVFLGSGGRWSVDRVWADASLQGGTLSGYIGGSGVVTLVLTNNTGAALDLPEMTFYVEATSRL